MKKFLLSLLVFSSISLLAAYQYNIKGNQGWLTFDSDTTVAFDLDRSGKDNDHENFIDRGEGIADYGWYNLDTGETGSFNNGASATFGENDRIGLYVTDNTGTTYYSTKPDKDAADEIVWGKSKTVDGSPAIYGGNIGSNGTHEYYVFKINSVPAPGKAPSGQPLPGIIATLIVGGGAALYLKKRKKLIASK